MNINLNIPVQLVTRIAEALERIAASLEHSVKSSIPRQQEEPFGKEYFSVATNDETYNQEVEDWLQHHGYGRDYRTYIETEVKRQLAEIESQSPGNLPPVQPDH